MGVGGNIDEDDKQEGEEKVEKAPSEKSEHVEIDMGAMDMFGGNESSSDDDDDSDDSDE